jgi:dTDP-4-amino-4,6-dideoxygalactose transaminase
MTRIPFLRPNLVTLDKYARHIRSVDESRCYSNFGPLNRLFEERVRAEFFGGTGAVLTVNNATSGLMLAIALMRRKGARYAIMPSFTFAATPLAAMWAGLEPYFIDVEPDTFAIGAQSLQRALDDLGEEVAVVVPYAAFGLPIALDIYTQVVESGIPVVADAAASFGATHEAQGFGTGFPGAIVFSLHATKAFGVGEGGVVYSSDVGFIESVRQASNFGFDDEKICRFPGLNAKLPEFAAAIALATLDEFADKKNVRRQIYAWYRAALAKRGLLSRGWTLQQDRGEVAHQFFPLLCPPGVSNVAVARAMAARGIQVRTYFGPPCHRQPAF